MNREEAINVIKGARKYLTVGNPIWNVKKVDEAFDMAIEALKEPRPKIAFACDGRKCGEDCSECGRTTDIEHAKNFIRLGEIYLESSPVVGPCKADHDHDGGEWIDITEGLTGGGSDK